MYHHSKPRHLHVEEYQLAGTYPLDYNFLGAKNPVYLIGMSVPPVMTAQVAHQVYLQWFSRTQGPAGS